MKLFSATVILSACIVLAMPRRGNADNGALKGKGKKGNGRRSGKKGREKIFSYKDILGIYGFNAQGVIVPPNGDPTVNAVSVGLLSFFDDPADEPGSFECEFAVALNGENGPGLQEGVSDTCTYHVKEDGTGTVDITGIPPVPIPLSFVIVDKGSEIRFIRTDPIGIAAGVAKRQY